MATNIGHWYRDRRGTSNGIPVVHVVANLERVQSWQAQTDTFLRARGVSICGNDYTTTNVNIVRNLFAPPTASNPNPRPVFAVINCVSNSPSHPQWQLLINHIEAGGGFEDYSANITAWRRIIDSVQAPPPAITGARFNGGMFEFAIPGQRGRTNRVEHSVNFLDWATLTNGFGTNGPLTIRDPDAVGISNRFYRVVRP
jgi:hypothetical protein